MAAAWVPRAQDPGVYHSQPRDRGGYVFTLSPRSACGAPSPGARRGALPHRGLNYTVSVQLRQKKFYVGYVPFPMSKWYRLKCWEAPEAPGWVGQKHSYEARSPPPVPCSPRPLLPPSLLRRASFTRTLFRVRVCSSPARPILPSSEAACGPFGPEPPLIQPSSVRSGVSVGTLPAPHPPLPLCTGKSS